MILIRITETNTPIGVKETRITRPRTSPKKQSQTTAASKTVPDDYLEILGSAEPPRAPNPSINNEEGEIDQLKRDLEITLQKAMKAAQDGDAEEASYLFRLHSRMKVDLPKRAVATTGILKVSKNQEVEPNLTNDHAEDIDAEKPIIENGMTFMPGENYSLI